MIELPEQTQALERISRRRWRDALLLILLALAGYALALRIDGFEALYQASRRLEVWEVDELLGLVFFGFFGLLLYSLRRIQDLTLARELLAACSRTDPLTGISNRAAITAYLLQEIERANRYGQSLTLIWLDLDNFMAVNQSAGHEASDWILRALADELSKGLRSTDQVGRMGGDEFLVVLPETELEGAAQVAERLLSKIPTLTAPSVILGFPLTACCSVARARQDEDLNALFTRMDEKMYKAKHSGKNRIILEDPLEDAAEPT